MQYRVDPKSGNRLSVLGFGCMRFPRTLGRIDLGKTEQLIVKAVEGGVNYFDTAYLYSGSEETLGTILHKNGLRDKIYLATKLPHAKCTSYEDFDTIFAGQLEKLQTDHIDYYLIHNLSDPHVWEHLCSLGIEKWIAEKKSQGAIRQLGFSFHGKQADFMALLEAYGWDFCQIQHNYVNINYQAGREGLLKAHQMGLPVVVMEPLLGGKLATGLPKAAVRLFAEADKDRTPAAWGFRWLWNQEAVTVVLSGMNDDAQLSDNLHTAEDAVPGMVTDAERKVYAEVLAAFNESYKVPCTGCNYCMPCPNNVNIPGCFAAYNMSYAVGMISAISQYVTSTGSFSPQVDYSPRQCTKCGICETKCPQHIAIPSELENVVKRMEPFWFRAVKSVMSRQRAKKA